MQVAKSFNHSFPISFRIPLLSPSLSSFSSFLSHSTSCRPFPSDPSCSPNRLTRLWCMGKRWAFSFASLDRNSTPLNASAIVYYTSKHSKYKLSSCLASLLTHKHKRTAKFLHKLNPHYNLFSFHILV